MASASHVRLSLTYMTYNGLAYGTQGFPISKVPARHPTLSDEEPH
jgi:hypothetical protein